MQASNNTPAPGDNGFETTQWSVVLALAIDPVVRAEALEKLCRIYWAPIYAYIRRRGHDAHDAQDLTQAFFTALLARDGLDRTCPERGKFRSFLVASVNHFLANERDRRNARKRGGGAPILSLDELAAEDSRLSYLIANEAGPEEALDRRWALTVLNRALRRLKSEFAAAGRESAFERLKRFLEEDARPRDYTALAVELRMSSGAVAVAVHRLRQRYRELVRSEIAQTVATPQEVDDELRHLFAVLWSGPPPL